MASYQRLALFVFFDAIERDLTEKIRFAGGSDKILTDEEEVKAKAAVSRQLNVSLDPNSPYDQIMGLDLGAKFQVLMRIRDRLDHDSSEYYRNLYSAFEKIIPVRNAIMHGRPLTIEEHSAGFSFAQHLLSASARWKNLQKTYQEFSKSPDSFVSRAVAIIDTPVDFGVLNNLPLPDYDDTGFFPRVELERLLKKRILGRYPVITVLGDGGNGKTALALQTLYGLVESNDHQFDLILWFSAKSSALSIDGVREIEKSVTSSSLIVSQAAEFEPGDDHPLDRLRRLLKQNRVLLAIDNLETVTGGLIRELVEDIPGDSKILLTSRVPVGGDLPINVPEFSEQEALKFLRIVIEAHSVTSLRSATNDQLKTFASRLGYKPLLLKWFVLGVRSGLDPSRITANPREALKFCLENVVEKLSPAAQAVSVVLATVPDAISAAEVQAVSSLTALHVEEGLGELSRFGLVDAADPNGVDRVFKLRSFVRSYIVRIVEPSARATTNIREAYIRVEADFERERMKANANRYDMRHFTIRSRSEAIAVRRLRELARIISQGLTDEVEAEIADLKIINPAYFEVYRFEAFTAFQWSDIPRAIAAYEAALEFGDSEPQLHFFFAGMLMRSGYLERAAHEFDRALAIDPNSEMILREAARNECRLHRFDRAQIYLARAATLPTRSQKHTIILMDLNIQMYVRKIGYFVELGDFSTAAGSCRDLLDFLSQCDERMFDETIFEHIRDVMGSLARIRRDGRTDDFAINALSEWVRIHASLENQKRVLDSDSGTITGFLKQNGRKPTFGFLVDGQRNETFVAAANLDPDVWDWLNQDGAVSYEIASTPKGTVAINVRQIK